MSAFDDEVKLHASIAKDFSEPRKNYVTPNEVRKSIGLPPLEEGGDEQIPTDATNDLDLRTFNLVRQAEGLPPLQEGSEEPQTVNQIRAELELKPLPEAEGNQLIMFPSYYKTELMIAMQLKKTKLTREDVYKMLTKENGYAQFWGGPQHDSQWGYMDWVVFAEKYINEAKQAWQNFTPDTAAVRIRMLKAASLLVSGLTYLGEPEDMDRIAGVSSSKFPIYHGGLQTYKNLTEMTGSAVSAFIPQGSVPEPLVDAVQGASHKKDVEFRSCGKSGCCGECGNV